MTSCLRIRTLNSLDLASDLKFPLSFPWKWKRSIFGSGNGNDKLFGNLRSLDLATPVKCPNVVGGFYG
jgi:hypothetical protein